MILAIEIVIICLLFNIIIIAGTKKNPLGGLHNLPKPIQVRVKALPKYSDRKIKAMSTKERVLKKLPAPCTACIYILCNDLRCRCKNLYARLFIYTDTVDLR